MPMPYLPALAVLGSVLLATPAIAQDQQPRTAQETAPAGESATDMTPELRREIRQEVRRQLQREMARHERRESRQESRRSEDAASLPPSAPSAYLNLLTGDSGTMQRLRGAALRTMFALADSSGDSAVSVEEAQELAARLLNGVDADGDGLVALEELNAFVGGGRASENANE